MTETSRTPPTGRRQTTAGAPELSVVVTLYNEAGSLPELHRRTVEALTELGRSFEIVYVDDGSTDGTFAILEELHAADHVFV